MERNKFGINLDEGIPLHTPSEFDSLYVPNYINIMERLIDWIKEGTKSLLLGGQIGSGKSTLLNKLFHDNMIQPDIILKFDVESINLDQGDFFAITLAGFIRYAIDNKVDLSFSKLPKELADLDVADWQGLLDILEPSSVSMDTFNEKVNLRRTISKKYEYLNEVILMIGEKLQKDKKEKLFIFASGIDKFRKTGSSYLYLKDVIKMLIEYKTLFEVNVIHLFTNKLDPLSSVQHLYLTAFSDLEIEELLIKRMGMYAQNVEEEIKIIAKWSGGNPRQAIRLLNYYQINKRNINRNKAESLVFAIRNTISDFFVFKEKPSLELIKTVERDKFCDSALLSLPGDRDTAQLAIYENWLLLSGENNETKWPVIVNPLVKTVFNEILNPEEPEIKLLNEFANFSQISAKGLSFNRITENFVETSNKNNENPPYFEKEGHQLIAEYLATGVEIPLKMNLMEIMDVISVAILSKDRADRVIIAYQNNNILDVAKAFIIAKANSYEYQKFEHRTITGGISNTPIEELKSFLSIDSDIYSIELTGDWTDKQIELLELLRDEFINYEIILWVPLEQLKHKYLPKWTQLRQLFEVFVLEDELFGSLTEKEIEDDLEFYSSITDDKDTSASIIKDQLNIVLKYLKENIHGE